MSKSKLSILSGFMGYRSILVVIYSDKSKSNPSFIKN